MGADQVRTELSGLLRPDGSVVVPPEVAGEVLRCLVRDVTARVRADGGELSDNLRTLLYALHSASEGQRAGSVSGDRSDVGSGQVQGDTLTVAEAAQVLECSTRWVRILIDSGRLAGRKAGPRLWLLDAASLDRFRHGEAEHGREQLAD